MYFLKAGCLPEMINLMRGNFCLPVTEAPRQGVQVPVLTEATVLTEDTDPTVTLIPSGTNLSSLPTSPFSLTDDLEDPFSSYYQHSLLSSSLDCYLPLGLLAGPRIPAVLTPVEEITEPFGGGASIASNSVTVPPADGDDSSSSTSLMVSTLATLTAANDDDDEEEDEDATDHTSSPTCLIVAGDDEGCIGGTGSETTNSYHSCDSHAVRVSTSVGSNSCSQSSGSAAGAGSGDSLGSSRAGPQEVMLCDIRAAGRHDFVRV